MFRLRALQGLMVFSAVLYLTALRDVYRVLFAPREGEPHEQMLSTVMVVQAVFLLLAVGKPAAHRTFIAFTAWATAAHSAVMAIQSWHGVLRRSDLPIYLVMFVIGVAFILLIPPKSPATPAAP